MIAPLMLMRTNALRTPAPHGQITPSQQQQIGRHLHAVGYGRYFTFYFIPLMHI